MSHTCTACEQPRTCSQSVAWLAGWTAQINVNYKLFTLLTREYSRGLASRRVRQATGRDEPSPAGHGTDRDTSPNESRDGTGQTSRPASDLNFRRDKSLHASICTCVCQCVCRLICECVHLFCVWLCVYTRVGPCVRSFMCARGQCASACVCVYLCACECVCLCARHCVPHSLKL